MQEISYGDVNLGMECEDMKSTRMNECGMAHICDVRGKSYLHVL